MSCVAVVMLSAIGPGGPAVEVAPMPQVAGPLARHARGWDRTWSTATTFATEFTLVRTDGTFGKKQMYTGKALYMRPNFLRLRLDDTANPASYETIIRDGRSLFHYSGSEKIVTEHAVPVDVSPTQFERMNWAERWKYRFTRAMHDAWLFSALSLPSAADVTSRCDVTLFKINEHYVMVDIKPQRAGEWVEYEHIRMAVYGPNTPTPYLPSQVWLLKPHGDTELWKLAGPRVNVPGIAATDFEFAKPPEGWRVRRAPGSVDKK